MGIGFAKLQAINPRLILCSISGFGQSGPYRDWRAFDPVVQAMSGISSVTGYADRPPVRCGAALSDTSASLYGVIGILSALRARERTGHGDWVDVAMLDGSFFLLADILEFVTAGGEPERRGNGHPSTVPFNIYRARDGWITVAAVAPREWLNVLRALGCPELASDPRFDPSAASRRAHREEVDALVQDWVGRRTAAEAVQILQAHQIAAGPVRDLRDAFDDEHLHARDMVVPLEHPVHGPVPGSPGCGHADQVPAPPGRVRPAGAGTRRPQRRDLRAVPRPRRGRSRVIARAGRDLTRGATRLPPRGAADQRNRILPSAEGSVRPSRCASVGAMSRMSTIPSARPAGTPGPTRKKLA